MMWIRWGRFVWTIVYLVVRNAESATMEMPSKRCCTRGFVIVSKSNQLMISLHMMPMRHHHYHHFTVIGFARVYRRSRITWRYSASATAYLGRVRSEPAGGRFLHSTTLEPFSRTSTTGLPKYVLMPSICYGFFTSSRWNLTRICVENIPENSWPWFELSKTK